MAKEFQKAIYPRRAAESMYAVYTRTFNYSYVRLFEIVVLAHTLNIVFVSTLNKRCTQLSLPAVSCFCTFFRKCFGPVDCTYFITLKTSLKLKKSIIKKHKTN